MHNFNWSITGNLKIKDNHSKIWDVISKKSNLELFHPFCNKNYSFESINKRNYNLIKPMLQRYINCVMKGLEYYIKTGNVVSKNQFGGHNFFSN